MDKEQELQYLDSVERVLEDRIAQQRQNLDLDADEILEKKRSFRENFYGMQKRDVWEVVHELEDDTVRHVDQMRHLDTLLQQKKSPYFGRIDFDCDGDEERYYIGLASLQDDSGDFLIVDWRAPVCDMYYSYELGPAGYDVPNGRIEGALTRKRQYRIENGKMLYMFDSRVVVRDEILQMELSRNASAKMQNIVSTIQKEQNEIIRTDAKKTLIVQGAAGSGKTSVALHRVAYLLYRYRDTLKSGNILILSPNSLFSDYISDVLPELGEERIMETSFAYLAKRELRKFRLESRADYIDACFKNEESYRRTLESARFKSSPELIRMMDAFIEQRSREIFTPRDIVVDSYTVSADRLAVLYEDKHTYLPPMTRIGQIQDYVLEQIKMDADVKELDSKLAQSLRDRVRSFLHDETLQGEYNLFLQYLADNGCPAGDPIGDRVGYPDVYPLLLFKLKFYGVPQRRSIRHLIVDEMQDYTPAQFEILKLIFPCPKTILGDLSQIVCPVCNAGSSESLRACFARESVYVELNMSYRSTFEISEFCKSLLPDARYDSVDRHGVKPLLRCFADAQSQTQRIAQDIADLRAQGYTSVAVLCKTQDEARALHGKLNALTDVALLVDPDSEYERGVAVTTCAVAKGLEFDCVILPNCDAQQFGNETDRNPLYVCCTRALHVLHLYAPKGQESPLLAPALERGLLEIGEQ